MAQYALGKIAISIHAPTRGATLVELEKTMNEIISIHAPTRGATNYLVGVFMQLQISIHAPTRGATKNYYENVNGSEFQSTLLQEERHGFRVYR